MSRKAHNSSHVELRHKTWFAILVVPQDVRHRVGKHKFYKSTGTSDRYRAELIAASYVNDWKKLIDKARFQSGDPLVDEALELQHELNKSQGNGLRHELVMDILEEQTIEVAKEHGKATAKAFNEVATGDLVICKTLHPQWLSHQQEKGLTAKTIDQLSSDLEILYEKFPTLKSLTPENVDRWVEQERKARHLSPASFNRVIGSFRNFLSFLKAANLRPRSVPDPFHIPDEYKVSKGSRSKTLNKVRSWVPFSPAELVKLHEEAKKLKSPTLATLIVVAAYTGARIEEICSLKVEKIDLKAKTFHITDSKTEASTRQVPIHTAILPIFKNLVAQSSDGYLFSRLPENKYGARGDALGKAFGRLKTSLGYGSQHVFHSIRKTTVTALENCGIPENVCADIVGHQKPNMTFGLYSGGTTVEVKRKAIQKIKFDFSF